jgi:hypothetical protein
MLLYRIWGLMHFQQIKYVTMYNNYLIESERHITSEPLGTKDWIFLLAMSSTLCRKFCPGGNVWAVTVTNYIPQFLSITYYCGILKIVYKWRLWLLDISSLKYEKKYCIYKINTNKNIN